MAYTIIRSDGAVLTTIQDGTINTTSTSLGLPGRNYSGYGQTLDTNYVRIMESFASSSPPPNPLKGQLWFNTTSSTMCVCPLDGETVASNWLTLTSTSVSGNATLANVNVTGTLVANNVTAANAFIGDTIDIRLANVSANLNVSNANITTAKLGALNTTSITTGGPTVAGSITGIWTVFGNSSGNGISMSTGNIAFSSSSVNGIKCDNYMYANGVSFNPAGTYNNGSVYDFLTGSNAVVQFNGNIAPTKVTTTELAGGGNISGLWQLSAGARLQATYADLAERFEADSIYDAGTVVELGGINEITAVVDELSDSVFGVVSKTAAFTMNGAAGDDNTHPAIAISGRVQVKVTGKVKKGDRLVSAGKGIARSAKQGEVTAFNSIGRSLTNKTTDGLGEVLAIVIIK
ncbi:MAG: hypothetical protein ACOVLB_07245 [Candidatus Nanopelagicus sp.]